MDSITTWGGILYPQLKWRWFKVAETMSTYLEVSTKSLKDVITKEITWIEMANATQNFWAEVIDELAKEILAQSYIGEYEDSRN